MFFETLPVADLIRAMQANKTMMDAIISATRHGALTLGIENKTGTIQKGKIANLVLLSDNPAQDIDNIDKVELVIKNGKLYNAN